jgi:hypothetical protein
MQLRVKGIGTAHVGEVGRPTGHDHVAAEEKVDAGQVPRLSL